MKLLFVLLLTFSLFQGATSNIDDLSEKAEMAYTSGHFQEAAKLYQQIIDAGIQKSEVYFNLGNAYYQLHDLGRSLLNYRRAEQFIPRDEDLRLNVAHVRAQRIDPPVAYVGIGDQIAQWMSSLLSNSESGQIILVLWWMACGSLSAYTLFPHWRKWARLAAIISGVVLIFVGVLSAIRVVVDQSSPLAIVVSENAPVLTGPAIQYMQIFELHAAGEVRMMERRNDWVRIQLPDLQEGWIKADSIEVI